MKKLLVALLTFASVHSFAQSPQELQALSQQAQQAQQGVNQQIYQQDMQEIQKYTETQKMLQLTLQNSQNSNQGSHTASPNRERAKEQVRSQAKNSYECRLTFYSAGESAFPSHIMTIYGGGSSKYTALISLIDSCAKVPGASRSASNRSRCAEAIILTQQVCSKGLN